MIFGQSWLLEEIYPLNIFSIIKDECHSLKIIIVFKSIFEEMRKRLGIADKLIKALLPVVESWC